MDPQRHLPSNLLLLLFLAFELSCTTGEGSMNCPKILGALGHSVLLPFTSGENKTMNKSKHILVTVAESPGSSVKKKIVSFHQMEGDSPGYLENRYQFHLEDLSLEILESKKEDEGWYTMTQEENVSVQLFCLQLKLYEQVSTPEIKVVSHTQENGNCSLTLDCLVETGDQVTVGWREVAGAHPLSPAIGSNRLHLTLGPQHADNTYICTVSNPISNRSQAFHAGHKCMKSGELTPQWGLYAGLVLGGIIGVVMIIQAVILLLRRKGKIDHNQPTMEGKNRTIYAQVQKSGSVHKKPDPLPAQDPCTTIYVAAAEPVLEPAPELTSITVYASVMPPES
ncbi:PREDICTED: signaling lymphocytic activation molecule [Condylura cristata]|uniref:signaling lymphocytic activation molecule n=1 Tax=Condylura cristata TaxID=143302 RepID=UPI0006436958|nr:PREDICTED: signaling lymphocytic activation molecule [Condylura cristata]